MNDYKEKFNNTKHFEKAIDVAYDSDKEYIRFLEQQLQKKDKVIEAVKEWRKKWIDQGDIEDCYDYNCECAQCEMLKAYDKYCEEIK